MFALIANLIKHISALLGIYQQKPTEELLREGLLECARAYRKINKSLKTAHTVGEKQQLQAALANVKSLRHQFELEHKTGYGIVRKETAYRRVKWEDLKTAFDHRIRTGVLINLHHKDIIKYLMDCKAIFKRRIQNVLKQNSAIKVNTVLCGEFIVDKADKTLRENKYLNTRNAPIYQNSNLDVWFEHNVKIPLLGELEEFQERDSGWALSKIVNLTVNINKYNPMRAGSYIDLPSQIKNRKACVNVQNSDNLCFAWAVISALFPVDCDFAKRTSSYPNPYDVLNLKGIKFPMNLSQVSRFENQNDISVNVYSLKKTGKTFKVIPAYITKKKNEYHINLLMVQDSYYSKEEEMVCPIKIHFVWIKNLSRLVSAQLSEKGHAKYICDRCLHYFSNVSELECHLEDCKNLNDGSIPKVPINEKRFVEFINFSSKTQAPFVIYADSECLLVPFEDDASKNIQKYQSHIPFSIGYYVKCSYDDTLSFYKYYTGKDCIQWFVKELFDFAENVETVFQCSIPMDELTPEQVECFYKARDCHVCEKAFAEKDNKVRDHCHLTGVYRGPAHETCNLNFQDSHIIPVLFHSLSSYDGHLLIKALAEVEGRIDVLPVNKEKYISFTKHIPENRVAFRFLDSFRFMASGLDKLSSYLFDFPNLKSEFGVLSEEHFRLLTRKGIFPYDFMDGWSKINDSQLPSKPEFYNRLEDKYISDDDYAHAQKVWNTFQCETMQDYSELYMKTDILLLADVFEQFRFTSHETYGLDPAHSFTLPGYSWQCMLYQLHKSDHPRLELLTDLDMVMFIEKGIRGGLSQCSKRYAQANNKYMPSYDPSTNETFLMYFDVNNQYGWAMSQYLPFNDFKWLADAEISSFNVLDIADTFDRGFVLEVDFEIPHDLHDLFSDLPPCPEHQRPPGAKNVKLLATLFSKQKYVIHYRNLKQALELGVKLLRIHRAISFNQSPWLKSYIDLNTRLRQASKNDFEKNLFKLMINAIFGKTMENVRKHSSIKLVTRWEGRYAAEALISRPEFKSSIIISENLVIIELAKSEVYFNKPIYVGMCILDLAKSTIYNFHYGYMKNRFQNCTVLYTDTDSLIYEIVDSDVYNIIADDCHNYFDTSDYPLHNIYQIPLVNKKVLGLMKDENNGRIMTKFIGLRSKMYATKVLYMDNELQLIEAKMKNEGADKDEIIKYFRDKGVTKKIKGVKKNVIQNKITFEDYMECLESYSNKTVEQNLICSSKHDLFTIKQTKVALSPYDNKRHLLKDSFSTMPHGHHSIMELT